MEKAEKQMVQPNVHSNHPSKGADTTAAVLRSHPVVTVFMLREPGCIWRQMRKHYMEKKQQAQYQVQSRLISLRTTTIKWYYNCSGFIYCFRWRIVCVEVTD